MKCREAATGDIETISDMHIRLIMHVKQETGDDYWDFASVGRESVRDYIASFFDRDEKKLFVCETGGSLAGFIAGEIVPCHLPLSSIKNIGYISAAFVEENHRKKGILRELEAMMTAFFLKKNIKYSELHYIANNVIAREAWAGMGYAPYRIAVRKKIGG